MPTIPMSQGSAFLRPCGVMDVNADVRFVEGTDCTVSLESWSVTAEPPSRASARRWRDPPPLVFFSAAPRGTLPVSETFGSTTVE